MRNASAMGAATFMSRILGLVREQVIAILFGAGWATDAYVIAFRIPNLLRDLFAEGAMSSALVPTFTSVREKEGETRAWRVAGRVFRVLFWLVCGLTVLGMIYAPELVNLYASEFKKVPGKFELTVLLTRILFPFFPLVALAAAYMGILNACGRFFLPAFASALFNLTSIVTGVGLSFLAPRFGYEPITGLAVGVVLGGAVQAFCQLPSLYRVGYRWPVRVPGEVSWTTDPALRQMLALMIPGMVGLAATQINLLVNSILATSQGTGAVSWLSYAFRLLQFPIGIFGVSLAAASLPRVSKAWVREEYGDVTATITSALRQAFAINLPAAAGLAFLGVPIVALLFEYGQFTSADTSATALALAAYSVGLAFYSVVKILAPACYAMGNSRTPVISSLVSVLVTIVLNLALVGWSGSGPIGFWGLALGTSIGALVNALQLLFAVRRQVRARGASFPLRPIFSAFGGYLLVALIMGGVVYGIDHLLASGLGGGFLARWVRVGCGVGAGALVALGVSRIFGLAELSRGVGFFLEKAKKKLSVPRK